jgi:hypothetical protein
MEIAPDFFDYFEAAAALLDKDKYVFFFLSSSCTLNFNIKKQGILGFWQASFILIWFPTC